MKKPKAKKRATKKTAPKKVAPKKKAAAPRARSGKTFILRMTVRSFNPMTKPDIHRLTQAGLDSTDLSVYGIAKAKVSLVDFQ